MHQSLVKIFDSHWDHTILNKIVIQGVIPARNPSIFQRRRCRRSLPVEERKENLTKAHILSGRYVQQISAVFIWIIRPSIR